jgi:hypothetical protein
VIADLEAGHLGVEPDLAQPRRLDRFEKQLFGPALLEHDESGTIGLLVELSEVQGQQRL